MDPEAPARAGPGAQDTTVEGDPLPHADQAVPGVAAGVLRPGAAAVVGDGDLDIVTAVLDPHNRPIYWIGPAGAGQEVGPGTDFHAVASGFVSVSPIKVDLTAHEAIPNVATWFERFR